jgi:hypothetical protein
MLRPETQSIENILSLVAGALKLALFLNFIGVHRRSSAAE